ncbi:hypothetical protein N7468_001866 [Penicillium chermesinum]|uniref:Uncharacterized protein n=1 Tax=Penicillium chermesinum TaxID=63820 RepID=A0A9W9PJJ9_9EURO|nr:uncharacterized protein N7468_001866 [Penicillium chermesinum]KAJ5246883.1 hypothetical protein N7468_001866 [Penicillium chermesinum]
MTTIVAVSSVYAHPIREPERAVDKEGSSILLPREPRLIPDTTNYIAQLLNELGVGPPVPSETPALVPTPTVTAEQGQPEDHERTPSATLSSSSSTSSATSSSTATPTEPGDTVQFTTTIKNENDKPIHNIQFGAGWKGGNRIEASDIPVIFDAVYTELAHRFNDMVDSSDEMTLRR